LLRSSGPIESQIFAWDVKLAELSGYIFTQRQEFIRFINTRASRLYAEIAGSKLPIRTKYQSSCNEGEYTSTLLNLLELHLQRDKIFGSTGDGIHRDDMAISFN